MSILDCLGSIYIGPMKQRDRACRTTTKFIVVAEPAAPRRRNNQRRYKTTLTPTMTMLNHDDDDGAENETRTRMVMLKIKMTRMRRRTRATLRMLQNHDRLYRFPNGDDGDSMARARRGSRMAMRVSVRRDGANASRWWCGMMVVTVMLVMMA